MPRPPIDLHRKVRETLTHVDPLPAEADTPLTHYNRSSTDLWNLLLYVERNFGQLPLRADAVRRHMSRLHGMVLVNLVETFARYLMEVAAACVDGLARFVLDDRFNAFRVQGSALAAHFNTDTLGRSLCESATWLDCDEVNDRIRRLLMKQDPATDVLAMRATDASRQDRQVRLPMQSDKSASAWLLLAAH